jgi:hypothetical protein
MLKDSKNQAKPGLLFFRLNQGKSAEWNLTAWNSMTSYSAIFPENGAL